MKTSRIKVLNAITLLFVLVVSVFIIFISEQPANTKLGAVVLFLSSVVGMYILAVMVIRYQERHK